MKGVDKFVSIHLCVEPVGFRKGLFSLAALIQSEFGENPFSGSFFLFTRKNKKSMRAVYWDETGFAMWCKAFEQDRFSWPKSASEDSKVIIMNAEELKWLLKGLNPFQLKTPKPLSYTQSIKFVK